ncbi:hypothetical protein PRN20_02755 [Devosia sp. ZB163]|uniref:hypothetical protein n=1 Tax=Devosia sp. ZB163 TaxID=3025938 RepID=UPI00235FB725|nr:hypothetical protein [Devosia sp. ZB163]MDC9822643.1 hypothetical protein [Devosia sp. ZB163]
MDFGSVPDWIVAIAAALAAWQGIKSLNAWRREEAGRRRMELAEVALSEFYEARDIFKWVRSPAREDSDPAAQSTPDDPETRIQSQRDIYYPILKRLADDGDFFGRMRARRYRVQALFGPAGAEPYDIINDVHGKVALAAKMLVQTQQQGTPTEAEMARSGEWQDTVWDDAEGSDEINDRIELAIRKAEEVFRPTISV